MVKITYVTPGFAVAPALAPADFARVAELGFRTVINNRPDSEERGQLPSSELRAEAEAHGLGYQHVPATRSDIFTDPVVEGMAAALESAQGPVLAHCKSGLRSAMVWAAARARSAPVDEIMGFLASAGFDLAFIRDDLDSQADRAQWNNAPAVDGSAGTSERGSRAAA